jgi:hypothetical protein
MRDFRAQRFVVSRRVAGDCYSIVWFSCACSSNVCSLIVCGVVVPKAGLRDQPDRHVVVDLHFRQIRSPAHELAKVDLQIRQARVLGSVPLVGRIVFELSRVTTVISEIERWRSQVMTAQANIIAAIGRAGLSFRYGIMSTAVKGLQDMS